MGCTGLTTVEIERAESIGHSAFDGCEYIQLLSISDRLSFIGSCAFRNCKLIGRIEFPVSLIEVGSEAFAGCDRLVIAAASPSAIQLYAETNGHSFEVLTPPAEDGTEDAEAENTNESAE